MVDYSHSGDLFEWARRHPIQTHVARFAAPKCSQCELMGTCPKCAAAEHAENQRTDLSPKEISEILTLSFDSD